MDSKRILVTGISHYWGGRLAQALEQNESIEAIIGVDSEDPTRELERTEFVRVGTQHALLRRMTGLLYFPITPTFPWLGPLGMLGYLPAKFKIRFLEPIRFDEEGMDADKSLVQTVAQDIRARIQENLWDMLAERKSVWFG